MSPGWRERALRLPQRSLRHDWLQQAGAALRLGADALLAVLLAPACAACGRILERPLDGAVCQRCWSAVAPITPPVCDGCGDPLAVREPAGATPLRCRHCRRVAGAVDRGRSVGEYDGALREIIHALKYQGRRSLAVRLAVLMRERGADLLDGADAVVPVPLHWRRQRARGFNQAEALAAELGLPVWNVVRRMRPTTPQVELPAGRRHGNVRGAFELRQRRWSVGGSRRPAVRGCSVVLVDDVSTTGATLEACARVLKAAGAREVCALTAARVVRRPL